VRGGTVLVVGATGQLGGPVASQLLQDGFVVRLLVRDVDRARRLLGAGFDHVQGDVTDPAAVRRALQGCDAVHVSLMAGSNPARVDAVEHRGTACVAERAAAQGISRLTYLSGEFAGDQRAMRSPIERAKSLAEQAIEQSGVPFTIFKPTYFMDTLPRHIQGRLAVVLGRPRPVRMVAASDFARMVSHALGEPAAANRRFYVYGPEAVTIADGLRLYCKLVQPGPRVVTVPLRLMSMINTLFMGGRLRRELDTMSLLQRIGPADDGGDADKVLGPATTTLRQWCQQQRLGTAPALAGDPRGPAVWRGVA
jgi:uncharacterized protein YbjT (DUF2867 family)